MGGTPKNNKRWFRLSLYSGSYGKLAGSNSLTHLGMAKPLTHGLQVTLLRTEASTAFSAKKAGKSSVQGGQEMKGMMNWGESCFCKWGARLALVPGKTSKLPSLTFQPLSIAAPSFFNLIFLYSNSNTPHFSQMGWFTVPRIYPVSLYCLKCLCP